MSLKVTYLGQCGFLLDFGHTRLVTDPYLSYQVDSFATEAVPWKRLYPPPAVLADLDPDGIVISHSHEDHMDAWTLEPYISGGGEAVIAAPAPECGLLERLNAPDIIYARAEEPFLIGGLTVTPVPCAHTELHLDEQGRFRELSYLITDGDRTVFFGGDMSLFDGLVRRIREAGPDLLLLPANGGDPERTAKGIIGNINEKEAACLAASVGAPYIPMHHDLYAVNGCDQAAVESAAAEAGARILPLKPGETLILKN